jgi:hypothetical protein
VAGVEVLGEPGEDLAPILDLVGKAFGIQFGGLGQDTVAGLETAEAQFVAGTDGGERDRGELRLVGDDGVERKLGRVGRGPSQSAGLAAPVL